MHREQVRRIMIALNRIDGVYYANAKKFGVNPSILALFYVLNDGKRHSQKQISEEWLIPRTTVNTAIKELESLGYIELKAIPGQRREREICLTPKGQAYAEQMFQMDDEAEAAALANTLESYSPEFISGLEAFSFHLKAAFEAQAATDGVAQLRDQKNENRQSEFAG